MTLKRRCMDVVLTSCDGWEDCLLCSNQTVFNDCLRCETQLLQRKPTQPSHDLKMTLYGRLFNVLTS